MMLLLILQEPPCTATNTGQIILGLLVVVGAVVNALLGEWRTTRQHARTVREAQLVEKKVMAQADIVEARLVERAETLETKLDRNMNISQKAFNEANNANQKIAAIGASFNKLLTREQAREK